MVQCWEQMVECMITEICQCQKSIATQLSTIHICVDWIQAPIIAFTKNDKRGINDRIENCWKASFIHTKLHLRHVKLMDCDGRRWWRQFQRKSYQPLQWSRTFSMRLKVSHRPIATWLWAMGAVWSHQGTSFRHEWKSLVIWNETFTRYSHLFTLLIFRYLKT